MSDTAEPSVPADRPDPTPFTIARLRHTPLRDLARGRITGRLNWRQAIEISGLPTPIRQLITRVTRRTRLWRLEKAAVAQELVAHFADALEGGASASAAIEAFGDERQAAKLIRRAKRRGRPAAWHAFRWICNAALVLLAIEAVLVVRFMLGRPRVTVDYLAEFNAPALAVPQDERAWPLYAQAIPAFRTDYESTREWLTGPYAWLDDPTNPDFREKLAAWRAERQDALALVRTAATKPVLGFIYGPGGSGEDTAVFRRYEPPPGAWRAPPRPTSVGQAVLNDWLSNRLDLPYVNELRYLGTVLGDDCLLAVDAGDAALAEADVIALLGMARQCRAGVLIEALVAMNVNATACWRLQHSLLTRPELFDDAALRRLAHATAQVGGGGDTAASLVDFDGERKFFYDLVQRIYTDDGHGDGRLTNVAADVLFTVNRKVGVIRNPADDQPDLVWRSAVALLGSTNSRADNVREYDRLMDLQEAAAAKPYREAGAAAAAEVQATLARMRESAALNSRYYPVLSLLPSTDRAALIAERVLAQRDATTTAIALECYRRRHGGAYPASLNALVPELMPRVPLDRINGQPLRYRLVDGKPLLYSVGADGDDDGGRVPLRANGEPEPYLASIGNTFDPTSIHRKPGIDGDWVVYGQPLLDAAERGIERERAMRAARISDARAATRPTTDPS